MKKILPRFIPKKIGIATYIISSTTAMFLIVTFFIFLFSYNETKNTFSIYCNKLAMASNAQAISVINGDKIEHFSKTLVADDEFKSFKKRADNFAQTIGVKYFYILFDIFEVFYALKSPLSNT